MKPVNKISLSLAIIGLVVILVLLLTEIQQRQHPSEFELTQSLPDLTLDYELVRHDGTLLRDEDLHGKYQLIYFGFAFCPDICPFTLDLMANALGKIGAKADLVQPVFITLDPERDTPSELEAYINAFFPGFIGLTGTPEAIDQAAKALKVYYRKVAGETSDSDYVIDHSSIIYLFDQNGKFIKFFTHEDTSDTLAAALAALITEQPVE
jgi:cytochrome oxidase Cu insertion factor (SCO1/SenC/PrrC family)